jgi:hypothetical protein
VSRENPEIVRLGYSETWKSNWTFSSKFLYTKCLQEDLIVKQFVSDFMLYSDFIIGDFRICRRNKNIIIFYSFYTLRVSSFNRRNKKKKKVANIFIGFLGFSEKRKNIIFRYFINKLTGIPRKGITLLDRNLWDGNGFYRVNTIRIMLRSSVFKRFRRRRYFRDSIYVVNTILILEDPDMLSFFLIKQVQKDYHHNLFVHFTKLLLCLCIKNFPNIFGLLIVFKGKLGKHGRKKQKVIKIGILPFSQYDSSISYGSDAGETKYGTVGIKTYFNRKFF